MSSVDGHTENMHTELNDHNGRKSRMS